ncbi:MAG: hypothetical protein PHR82_05735 [Endomicrobiaceae bacterium]|nr:hypothetical protein [Endomicrobiaceae bacterium]
MKSKLEIDIGFKIIAKITNVAYQNFQMKDNPEVWVLFKSLAIDFFAI